MQNPLIDVLRSPIWSRFLQKTFDHRFEGSMTSENTVDGGMEVRFNTAISENSRKISENLGISRKIPGNSRKFSEILENYRKFSENSLKISEIPGKLSENSREISEFLGNSRKIPRKSWKNPGNSRKSSGGSGKISTNRPIPLPRACPKVDFPLVLLIFWIHEPITNSEMR